MWKQHENDDDVTIAVYIYAFHNRRLFVLGSPTSGRQSENERVLIYFETGTRLKQFRRQVEMQEKSKKKGKLINKEKQIEKVLNME